MTDITNIIEQSDIRWSETITEFSKSYPAAQAEVEDLEKDAINTHTEKGYATLGATLAAVLPAFNKHGFAILQFPTTNGALVKITTRVLHSSGEWMEFDLVMRAESEAHQKVGTAITYGRRYSIQPITGIAPIEDVPAIEAAAKAKDQGQRLTKAQSRDLFTKLQAGLGNQSSVAAINKWLTAFDDNLKSMDVASEKHLRLEAQQEIEGHEATNTERDFS